MLRVFQMIFKVSAGSSSHASASTASILAVDIWADKLWNASSVLESVELNAGAPFWVNMWCATDLSASMKAFLATGAATLVTGVGRGGSRTSRKLGSKSS